MKKQSLVRRSLAVVASAVFAVAFAVAGASAPANAAAKGQLVIVSVFDQESQNLDPAHRPFDAVKGQGFNVVVEVRDPVSNQLVALTKATGIALKVASGTLEGTTTGTIPKDATGTTIRGAIYPAYGNGINLSVVRTSGVDLSPSKDFPIDVALSAVTRDLGQGEALDLQDGNCDGAAPTSAKPICGHLLLPEGANVEESGKAHVLMSVGSCKGLDCSTSALVVTAVADITGLYSKTAPATMILACDKTLCRELSNGVPKIDVKYTFDNGGVLSDTAPDCPAKGVLGNTQVICVDRVQSSRNQSDLYSYVLFDRDLRLSHP